jgi:hypothetical protein
MKSFIIWDITPRNPLKANRRFGNWICFRPQMMGLETPTLFRPLERTNLNHWTIIYISFTYVFRFYIGPK